MTEKEKLIKECSERIFDEKKERREELIKRYYECDARFQKAKGQRLLITFLGFVVAYYFVFYSIEEPTDFLGFITLLLPSVFVAGFHVWLNILVFGYLSNKGREEEEILKHIDDQIRILDTQKDPTVDDIEWEIDYQERMERIIREQRDEEDLPF